MHDNTNLSLDLPNDLPLEQVHERVKRAVTCNGKSKRELAHFLTEMHERRLYRESGHGSTAHWAQAVHGIDPRSTRRYIQLGRAFKQLHLVRDAYDELGWSRTVKILSRVQLATQAEWIEFARNHSHRAISEEVKRTRQGDCPGEGRHGLVPVRHPFHTELTEAEHEKSEAIRRALANGAPMDDHEFHMRMVEICGKQVLVEEEQPEESEPEKSPTETSVPSATRDYVIRRDGYECVNCGWKINLHAHHIEAREDGGGHETSNLVALCHTCHSLVHCGKLFLSGNPEAGTLIRTDRNGELVEPPGPAFKGGARTESAGISRQRVEDERALQRRVSDHSGPESCVDGS